MGLQGLTTSEMISLSASWTRSDHSERLGLAEIPATAGLLAHLDEAHFCLLAAYPIAADPERRARIQAEERVVDGRHDDVIRGVYHVLTGAIFLAPEPTERKILIQLRDLIVPDGLRATRKSYRAEADRGSVLASLVSPAVRELLAGVQVHGVTLAEAVDEWIRLAARLGHLEDARNGVVPEGAPPGPDAEQVAAARERWLRTVNALATNLELVEAEHLSPSQARCVRQVRDRIRDASRLGDRRSHPTGQPEYPVAPSST